MFKCSKYSIPDQLADKVLPIYIPGPGKHLKKNSHPTSSTGRLLMRHGPDHKPIDLIMKVIN